MAFGIDGVSYEYKRNPLSQAIMPCGQICRKSVKDCAKIALVKDTRREVGGNQSRERSCKVRTV